MGRRGEMRSERGLTGTTRFRPDLSSTINYKNAKQQSKYHKCVKELLSDDAKSCERTTKADRGRMGSKVENSLD